MYGRGIFVNQNGTWVEVKNPQVKQGSTWVPIKKGFTNINGVWTQFWPSTGSMSYSSVGSYTFTVPYGIYTLNISAAGGGGGAAGARGGCRERTEPRPRRSSLPWPPGCARP